MKQKMSVESKNTNDKLNRNYVSFSDHPPIIDKKPLVGGESILRGNERGKKLFKKFKRLKLN